MQLKVISNNLKDLKIKNILDTKFYDGKLFVSIQILLMKIVFLYQSYSTFNLEYLNFSKLFSINAKGHTIDIYKPWFIIDNINILYEDTSIAMIEHKMIIHNKILFFNFDTNQLKFF